MAHSNYDRQMVRVAVSDDAEWQRVNSYIADILKDNYVLFAKLARLRGDFGGEELKKLDGFSSKIRDLGQEIAAFSKAFTEGSYSMSGKEPFGDTEGGEFEVPGEITAEDFEMPVEEEKGSEETEAPPKETEETPEEETPPAEFEEVAEEEK